MSVLCVGFEIESTRHCSPKLTLPIYTPHTPILSPVSPILVVNNSFALVEHINNISIYSQRWTIRAGSSLTRQIVGAKTVVVGAALHRTLMRFTFNDRHRSASESECTGSHVASWRKNWWTDREDLRTGTNQMISSWKILSFVQMDGCGLFFWITENRFRYQLAVSDRSSRGLANPSPP